MRPQSAAPPVPPGRRARALAAVVWAGLAVLAATAPGGAIGQDQATPWPTSGWSRGTPDSQGLDPTRFAALDQEIRGGKYGYVDRVLVTRRGRLVFDARYTQDYRAISRDRTGPLGCGEGCADPDWLGDYNYYQPDRHPYYRGREVHTLQSVTKTVTATVIGAALVRGDLKSLDEPFLPFLRDRDLSNIDARLRKATVRNLLTMKSGIAWQEQGRPLDDSNTTLMMVRSKDWIAFTLAQPVESTPGTTWNFNSGASQLLSGVVRGATGRFIDEYARDALFAPLGIRTWYWKKTPAGFPDTEGGLYLRAEDLAKIGYLYLRDGMWDGQRVLPEGFVRDATSPHTAGVFPGWDYGYQWWMTTRGRTRIWTGRGFGGQTLLVIPSLDVVAVAYAWNIFDEQAQDLTGSLLDAIIQR